MPSLYGHGLVSLLAISRDKEIVHSFVRELVLQNLHPNLSEILNFPDDMEEPVKHFYFGYNGLFSKHMDDLEYFSNYCEVLLSIQPDILFKDYAQFYDYETISTKKGIYRRKLEIEFKDLKDKRKYLGSFVAILEAQGRYIKPPKK